MSSRPPLEALGAARSGEALEAREARGLALMLLAAVGGGVLMGYLLTALHGIYLPLVMPGLAGVGLGILVSAPRRRFRAGRPWQAALLVVFGAALAYATYQLVLYIEITGFLAERLPGMMDRVAASPRAEVAGFLEHETGERGWVAYFAFTARAPHAQFLSPLGVAGRLEPGLGWTFAGMAFDLMALAAAAWITVQRRSRWVEDLRPYETSRRTHRTRQIIARVDAATLVQAMRAIDAGRFEEAGRSLRDASGGAEHAIVLIYDPDTAEPWDLEVLEDLPDAGMVVRASRQISSWNGQLLWDELRAP